MFKIIKILILLLVLGGVYIIYELGFSECGDWYVKCQKENQTTSDQAPNTSDWKLHTNTAWGISFNYPKDWSVISMTDWNGLQEAERASYKTPGHIVFSRITTGKYTSYEAFKDETAYQSVDVISEKDLTIDGSKAIAVRFTPKGDSTLEYYRYHIFKGTDKYSFDIAAEGEVSETDIATFDKVMTTVGLAQ